MLHRIKYFGTTDAVELNMAFCDIFHPLERSISRKKRTIVHQCFVWLFCVHCVMGWRWRHQKLVWHQFCGFFVHWLHWKSKHVIFLIFSNNFSKFKNNYAKLSDEGSAVPKNPSGCCHSYEKNVLLTQISQRMYRKWFFDLLKLNKYPNHRQTLLLLTICMSNYFYSSCEVKLLIPQ